MSWNHLLSERDVTDREPAETRFRRVQIEDLDSATTVEVEVRREVGYLTFFLRHGFRLQGPGNPSIAG